jgi:hypothetical protein
MTSESLAEDSASAGAGAEDLLCFASSWNRHRGGDEEWRALSASGGFAVVGVVRDGCAVPDKQADLMTHTDTRSEKRCWNIYCERTGGERNGGSRETQAEIQGALSGQKYAVPSTEYQDTSEQGSGQKKLT